MDPTRSRPALRDANRTNLGICLWPRPLPLHLLVLIITLSGVLVAPRASRAETRPRYGGTLRMMLQWTPSALELPATTSPSDYWDATRTLSLIGDTLVKFDSLGRPQPGLAIAWQSDANGRSWHFTLRHGVKFHDGSSVTVDAITQILSAANPSWKVRPSAGSLLIEGDNLGPSLLAELALPRNLLLRRNVNGIPVGTGPFVVAEWQPGKLLKLAANDESWAGRPFLDAMEIEFGKSLRDQSIAFELDKCDVIETAPSSSANSRQGVSSSSLPVDLLTLVFEANAKTHDPRLREALALAIDRKPIQSVVLLKGAGEPAASILPNWMTGYSVLFSTQPNPQRARALLAGSRQPALNLSYDPSDAQAKLIAERLALNAREVGITVQVSLSGPEDIRLMRIILPSPDPATALSEAARQMGLPAPALQATPGDPSVEVLFRAERSFLEDYSVIPLFHLPLAGMANPRVRGWGPGSLIVWDESVENLSDVSLTDRRADRIPDVRTGAGPR